MKKAQPTSSRPEEAREAGRKGGEAVSQDREHMAAIGRKGGEARGNREMLDDDVVNIAD